MLTISYFVDGGTSNDATIPISTYLYHTTPSHLHCVVESRPEEVRVIISKSQRDWCIHEGCGDRVRLCLPSPLLFHDSCDPHPGIDTEWVKSEHQAVTVEVGVDSVGPLAIALE